MAPFPNAQQASQQAARAADRAQVTANNTANKLSKWVEENRTLVIALATGTLALGGYYFYSRSSSKAKAKGTVSDSDDEEKAGSAGGAASGSANKKKKKKGTKKKTVGAGAGGSSSTDAPSQRSDGLPSDPSGPLLDEATDDQLAELPESEIKKLPASKREDLSKHLKNLGNKAYSNRQFEKAIDHYTKAIAAHPVAVFYSNRAACFANLSQPEKVVADCDEALKMDRVYVKALNRRAVAKEQLGNPTEGEEGIGEDKAQLLFDSLADFTAVAILGQFKDQTATESVERVLRKLATGKAQDILKNREPKLPSPTFVTAYLEAFRSKPKPELPANPSQGDETLLKAYGALEAKSYPHALTLFNEAIEQGLSNEDLEANAYNNAWNVQVRHRQRKGSPRRSGEEYFASTELCPELGQEGFGSHGTVGQRRCIQRL